jgi:hypothetical protein
MKLRATLAVEYEVNPEDYGTDVPAKAAAMDQEWFRDDPSELLYRLDHDVEPSVRVEPA